MRNLKRALSLTLASVMLLGMMVVGSSAAKGYDDVADTDNVEAIEVLQSIEVMVGDERGFGPERSVNRAEMAVVMGKLLGLDYNYYASSCPFNDVYDWARGYVGACYARHIVSGRGEGVYDPGATVTAVEAASMLMRALGYFQYPGDVADGFEISTVRQGNLIGIFDGVGSSATEPMTRNQVAQMVLNALQADMVTFTGTPGVEYTGSNGESWVGGYKAEYTPRTSTDPKYNRLIDNKHSSNIDYSGQYYVQMGEELFNGDLIKRYDTDIFERPSYTWTYKTEKIGTYLDSAKLKATYTKGVSGRDLYDLLNNITIRDYDLEIYVDGHEAGNITGSNSTDYNQYNYPKGAAQEVFTSADLKRSNTDDLGATGDGVLTEVFLDTDKEIITVTSIHTWLAQATSNYSETKESASVKVHMYYTAQSSGSLILSSQTKTVNVEDVPEVADVTADTFYLVRMSDKDTTKLEVVDMEAPTVLAESTITKFSLGTKYGQGADGNKYPTKLTVEGTEYNDSDRACYDVDVLDQYDNNLLTTNTYNVYLDKYGYFIGLSLHEGTKQYVFITGYDMRNSNLSIQTASAAGIFLDGTMENITVNVKDTNKNIKSMVVDKAVGDNLSAVQKANANAYYKTWGTNQSDGVYLLNRWYTYTENNGVYTLKPCVDKNGVAMMLASKTAETGDDDAQTLKLNCAKLRLDSVTDSGDNAWGDLLMGEDMQYTKGTTGTPVLTSARAYGEDASVFITVDTEEVSASAGGSAKLDITKAITNVNGVYTGVQDVDLITKTSDRIQGKYYANNADDGSTIGGVADADNDTYSAVATEDRNGHWLAADGDDSYLAENAYAVFDKNHFIIGAVILGEAEGNNATKAYILDPVKYERYENGTYYWQFEAVINGEIVTQEAESKFASTIDTMRNNQFEIVELRYNAAGDVVTDVKQIERKDTDATRHLDKIYGYPYAEIKDGGHKVADNETIYDVVLTGNSDAANVNFTWVERPRVSDNSQHGPADSQFTTTELGTLRLQGRTLYVLDNQRDYGLDFVKDAKAVVRQQEGYYDANGRAVSDGWKTRGYNSVQEAIDSLGDPIKTTGETEFRGIITAVLNSQGVAEWIVFYSDTMAETKNNNDYVGPTIEVEIRTQLPGGKAEFYDIIKVARPTDGTDIADIAAPDLSAKGFEPIRDPMYLTWKKYDERPVITFEYVLKGDKPVETEETMTVTINMLLQDKDGKFQSTLPGGSISVTKAEAEAGVRAPELSGYASTEAQKSVTFTPNGSTTVTFTYKALDAGEQQPEPPVSWGGQHPLDPQFAAAYEAAGMSVQADISANGTAKYTINGKNSDLTTWLSDESNRVMDHDVGGTIYAFVGFYFDSPTDKDGAPAASVRMYRVKDTGDQELGIGMDENHRLFQWVAVAKKNADGTWTPHVVNSNYRIEWTMEDGSVQTQLCSVVNAMS